MMQSSVFIIIDDDPINNQICRIVLSKAYPNAQVIEFICPHDGFNYIKSEFAENKALNAVLFLDINMPGLSGWEVLDLYDTLPEPVHDRIKVYLLSSSVDERDISRAGENKYVESFISKPLNFGALQKISQTKLKLS
jgi:response regulator RpfG family c-di-GMP phosphodiesterase